VLGIVKKFERQEQIKLVNYLKIFENQKKIISFFAVPNGGSRNMIEAKNMKAEGVRAGVSDICVILSNKVLFIEMKQAPKTLKSGKKSISGISVNDNQIEFLENIKKSDVCEGFICYGFDEAKKTIDSFIV
jgi:hypothetical protein